MSRYHRENPDQPIQHDAFEGAFVGFDRAKGNDFSSIEDASVSVCELCGEKNPSTPCFVCETFTHEELIEQAHETISGWKRLFIAAAIANGGQIVISPEQLLEAGTRRISIETAPWKDIRITVQPTSPR